MSTVEYCGDSTPHGIFKYWVRKTKHECAWEISRCWKRIKELENVLAQQQATKDCSDCLKLIEERDDWEERATYLAEAVGRHFAVPVGEHSSANCPISEAHKILNGEYVTKFDQTTENEGGK